MDMNEWRHCWLTIAQMGLQVDEMIFGIGDSLFNGHSPAKSVERTECAATEEVAQSARNAEPVGAGTPVAHQPGRSRTMSSRPKSAE